MLFHLKKGEQVQPETQNVIIDTIFASGAHVQLGEQKWTKNGNNMVQNLPNGRRRATSSYNNNGG